MPTFEMRIQEIGAVTSLGVDASNLFAAARAGITKSAPNDMFTVRDPDSGEGQGVITHEVPVLTHGFEGLGRFQQLMIAGLTDLARRIEPSFFLDEPIYCYIALPSLKRAVSGGALLADEEMSREWQSQQSELPEFNEEMIVALLTTALKAANVSGRFKLAGFCLSGQAAGGTLLEKIRRDLQKGETSKAILGGVDSYIGFHTINWLDYTGRLKTEDQAEAMQPAEGAAFLALTAANSGDGINIKACATGNEQNSLLSGRSSDGKVLNEVFQLAYTQLQPQPNMQIPWFVIDHNGESYRAREWGNTVTHIKANHPQWFAFETWFPAISFGDTGAAFVPLAIAQVFTALQNGYGGGDNAIICASSDDGLRTVLCVGNAAAER